MALLLLPNLAAAGSPPTMIRSDGSLVIGGNNSSQKKPGGDTLHTLLSKEVQVFIFRGKTRAWPQSGPFQAHYAPRYSGRSVTASPQLEAMIQKYARIYGVDPSLVKAVMRHESGFNPQATSPKGAQGLMQLMPGTAALMGVQNAYDPEQNIAGGVGYLRHCLDRFQQNPALAVAAYNAGPERVAKAGNTVPPIAETQSFVANVMTMYTGQPQVSLASKPASAAPAFAKQPPQKHTFLKTAPAKTVVTAEEAEKEVSRPRPKVIEVRFPKKKPAASAQPQQNAPGSGG
jgi:hypothetical protein